VNDGSAQFLLRAWTVPNLHDFLLLASCGLIAAIAFYLLSQAYRVAPASVVTPFEYSSLPVAVLFGYLVWGDLPAPATWAGLALIVGAGLYIVHREAVQGRKVVRGWPPMRPRL
jgi:S-adenosylmethionine uptake transporter